MSEFEDLKGKILIDINVDKINDKIIFTTNDGEIFTMYHEQDCCEGVSIDDVNGDIKDLLNTPILLAEKSISVNEYPEGFDTSRNPDSFTWTFYKLATINGYVNIRWYGESNGYYSEEVYFVKENVGIKTETLINNNSVDFGSNQCYASNSISVGKNAVNNHPNCIVFNTGNTTYNTLEFRENGEIYVHGKLIENDKQIVDGFRDFLNSVLNR